MHTKKFNIWYVEFSENFMPYVNFERGEITLRDQIASSKEISFEKHEIDSSVDSLERLCKF